MLSTDPSVVCRPSAWEQAGPPLPSGSSFSRFISSSDPSFSRFICFARVYSQLKILGPNSDTKIRIPKSLLRFLVFGARTSLLFATSWIIFLELGACFFCLSILSVNLIFSDVTSSFRPSFRLSVRPSVVCLRQSVSQSACTFLAPNRYSISNLLHLSPSSSLTPC
jgi:hypothetical protein